MMNQQQCRKEMFMISHEELLIIKDLFEEKTLSDEEQKVLDKINLLIEFDDFEIDYQNKRKEFSDRLNKISEK